jgi:hypothetical protein
MMKDDLSAPLKMSGKGANLMKQVVRAFPIQKPTEDLLAFAADLSGPRSKEATEFYRSYGIVRETWHLQETPSGPWAIAVTELADPDEAAPRYARASEEFHSWFKAQILSLTGVDPNVTSLGPPTTEVFAWENSECPVEQTAGTS